MNEMIITEVENYEFGLVTMFEMVTQISTIDCKEGMIIAEQIEKIRDTDEYRALLWAFREGVGRLFQENREIDTIIGYYQVMMKK